MRLAAALAALAVIATDLRAEATEPLNQLQLQLQQALPIEGPGHLEPSGLARCGDSLLMVSDHHQDRVFALTTAGPVARAVPYLQFDIEPPPLGFMTRLMSTGRGPDFEGVTCAEGRIYLASESYDAVLELETDPPTASWRHLELGEVARSKGLFERFNAHLEGITFWKGELWLVAERQPRGWLRIAADGTVSASAAAGPVTTDRDLPADFTGVTVAAEKLLVLERNAERVCEIDPSSLAPIRCASFGTALDRADLRYATGKPYGLAEGLAGNQDHLWLVFDSNDAPRISDGDDRRPLLLQFANPF